MKVINYILIRILVMVGSLVLIWNGTYYTLSTTIQEHRFGFITEVSRIFRFSLFFSLLLLLFLIKEIYTFNKRGEIKLKKAALFMSLFVTLVVIVLIFLNFQY